jgi:hypothetical protein
LRPAVVVLVPVLLSLALWSCSGNGDADTRIRDNPGHTETSTPGSKRDVEPTSPVRFYREYVKVIPSPGSTKVSALYYFRNDSDGDIRQVIRYPFPVDRTHLYPYSVRVWEVDGSELRTMGFVKRDSYVLWTMELGARAEKTVRVDYVQEIREPRAIYIVTTTKAWKRPIELAEFEFRIPPTIKEYKLSFEPDRSETVGDTTVYYVSYESFMPDEDMIVTWDD